MNTSTPDNVPAALDAIAWMDGEVVDAAVATVPLMDEGVLRGDAVFEVVPVLAGRTHGLHPHLDRMQRSAAALDLDLPHLDAVVGDLLAAWGDRDGALKLIVTRSGTVRGVLSTSSWPPSMALAVVDVPWQSALSGVKTLSYAANQWATRQARAVGADDALVVDDGVVMELPTGSIGVVLDGGVRTPDPGSLPILDSVTMRSLSRAVPVTYTTLCLDDVVRAQELFVVSATRPVLGVHEIHLPDGRRVGFPTSGPVIARTREALARHMRETLDPRPGATARLES